LSPIGCKLQAAPHVDTFVDFGYHRFLIFELFFCSKSRSFVNKLLNMQRYYEYLHRKLDSIYPETEIASFSRLLLRELAGLSSVQIYSDKDRKFSEYTWIALQNAIDRLSQKEPIQYVLGETEFFGLTIHVAPGVLIPRPETEELVEWILKENQNDRSDRQLLDIGTGSGCIAVSLAKAWPNAIVRAWDVSTDALRIAKDNARSNHVDIRFEHRDVLNYKVASQEKESLDLLVSNPPYVCQSEASEMDPNVLNHEPHLALFVENTDPLLFYRIISGLAMELLKPGGVLYFEINSGLGNETKDLIRSYPFKDVALIQDISGKDRFIRATK
jgi:release factor glutamine methyltransferase